MASNSSANAPTILDVARLAGVSTASVSRVINNKGPITDSLSAKVNQAIVELDYKPHRVRAKTHERSPWLIALIEKVDDPFFQQMLSGIQDQANAQEYPLAIICVGDTDQKRMDVFEQLRYERIVGLIAAGVYMPENEWIEYQESIHIPLVVLNTRINHPQIASVIVDFETGVFQAALQMLSLNHRRLAYIGNYGNEFAAAQLNGIKRALKANGLEYPEEYRFSVAHTLEGASQAISKMMRLPDELRPTALFTFDDQLAIQVLNALRFYDLQVPGDISVIGFDNILMSAHSNPPLTTVDIPQRRIGRLMVTLIDDLLKKENDGMGATIIQGAIITRASTGPAKS
jgi:DNA-binding LacI/PurR family transcriptional regulator